MSNADSSAHARAVIGPLATLGDKIVSYRGADGDVTTTGYIEEAPDFLGLDVVTFDPRYVATLLVEDVGSPHSGDRVTDEDGAEWTMLDEIDRRAGFTDWTVERR